MSAVAPVLFTIQDIAGLVFVDVATICYVAVVFIIAAVAASAAANKDERMDNRFENSISIDASSGVLSSAASVPRRTMYYGDSD